MQRYWAEFNGLNTSKELKSEPTAFPTKRISFSVLVRLLKVSEYHMF